MEGDKLLQRFPSPDGKRWVELYERRDGLFYFREYYEAHDDIPNYGTETYTRRRDGNPAYIQASKQRRAIFKKWPPGFTRIQTEALRQHQSQFRYSIMLKVCL